MKIVSTNIGKSRTVTWKGSTVQTGIYKKPVREGLTLEAHDVKGDQVIDRKYHGGIDKAFYLFSADHYPYWKEKYPDLDWDYGMFGENLTVSDCNEKEVYIGDIYEVGDALVQVSQPRQPCSKLGIRFNSMQVIKDFINQSYPGVYFRVLQEGRVRTGDTFKLIEHQEAELSVTDVFKYLYHPPAEEVLKKVLRHPFLAESCRTDLRRKQAD